MKRLFSSRLLLSAGLWIGLSLAGSAYATTYWVATTGNDSNDCQSESNACRTVGRGVSLAVRPGDIVNIKSGTYNTAEEGCQYFTLRGIACLQGSGTESNPITVQAAPGHEGSVVLDGGTVLFGIGLRSHDYVTIQNLEIANMSTVGIVNGGPAVRNVADDSDFSVGVKIINNYIHNVVSVNPGSNPGGVRMDNSKDWLVKNNRIETVCGLEDAGKSQCTYLNSGCIYSYYIWNATIENNQCSNSGAFVHWKDHILDADGKPTLFGSLVRYNLAHDLFHGFYISHGNRDPESSNHVVTHNIFYNVASTCMALFTDTADGSQSVNYVFDHNICDGADVGIYSTSAQVTSSKGNIFSDITGYPTVASSDIYRFSNNDDAQLDYSNHNVFEPNFPRVNLGNPTTDDIYYTLSAWRSLVSSANIDLSSPDANSIEVSSDENLFTNISARDYTYMSTSPAVGLMPDGTNAGPYQTGNETIGLLPSNLFASRVSPIIQMAPVGVECEAGVNCVVP